MTRERIDLKGEKEMLLMTLYLRALDSRPAAPIPRRCRHDRRLSGHSVRPGAPDPHELERHNPRLRLSEDRSAVELLRGGDLPASYRTLLTAMDLLIPAPRNSMRLLQYTF